LTRVNPPKRIAIVHEWFTRWAGSEAVLEQILVCFPSADLFAISSHPDAAGERWLAGRSVRTSFIQRLPFGARMPQLWLPLLPLAAELLDLRGYDLVVSNSHCVAKGVITSPDCRHLAYVHSPARYAWDLQQEYQASLPWLARPLWAWQMHRLRNWDAVSAQRPDSMACNSAYIAGRIRHAWRREATVIHPPVDVAAFTPSGGREDVYVTASRMVGYKRMPLIAEAFAAMPGRRLCIIGDGSDLARVRAIAARAPNITVLGHVPRAEMIAHLRRARAFVFAAEEDFGIAPVEAMACGTPVIAFARGGAAETVIDGVTGRLFSEQSAAAIVAAVEAFERAPQPDPQVCRDRALLFAPERFRERFSAFAATADVQ
jgi:glycosyltransferase involved in cell wall biosynthesis